MNLAQVNTITSTSRSELHPEEDLRFAELAALSGLDPQLAQRLAHRPAEVLAEFGISHSADSRRLLDQLDQPTIGIQDLGAPDYTQMRGTATGQTWVA